MRLKMQTAVTFISKWWPTILSCNRTISMYTEYFMYVCLYVFRMLSVAT